MKPFGNFRKKPIIVQAEKTLVAGGIVSADGSEVKFNAGDYIITGIKGEQYPCPADVFEITYEEADDRPTDPPAAWYRTFGDAISLLKQGKKVARAGWNGKGIYLWLLPATTVPIDFIQESHLGKVAEANGGAVECLASIGMCTADGKVLMGWLASQTDMFAEDWYVLD